MSFFKACARAAGAADPDEARVGSREVKNEMLCIGKRTNYDAEVLVQASKPPGRGRFVWMPRVGRFVAEAARRSPGAAALPCRGRGCRRVPRSDEPARHIRKVTSLIEYRPVFAW